MANNSVSSWSKTKTKSAVKLPLKPKIKYSPDLHTAYFLSLFSPCKLAAQF